MKGLKILAMILAMVLISEAVLDEAYAETRTLTTTLIITVKAPETQSAQAPNGLEELYNSALSQSQARRIVKVEEPIYTPSGLPRYTMTERL